MTVAAPTWTGPAPESPYIGLVPFGEEDAGFFFGRSQEIAIVSANLRSARLTIVYGPSGVGKSSLLQAGVVHGLREAARAADSDAPFAVCTVRSWHDDPKHRSLQAASDALPKNCRAKGCPRPLGRSPSRCGRGPGSRERCSSSSTSSRSTSSTTTVRPTASA